jgi:predicted dehydrogenase
VLYQWGKEPEGLYTPRDDSFAVAMRDQVASFADCIRSGMPPTRAPAAASRMALALALASRESCESGQPVGIAGDEMGQPAAFRTVLI